MNFLERSAPHLPENAKSARNPCEGTAMDFASLIEPNRVVFGARASNKQQLLQDLASRAAALLNLDASRSSSRCGPARNWVPPDLAMVCAPACPCRRARSSFRHVRAAQPAGPFRFDRWQTGRSCVSPSHPGDGGQRAPRRARRGSRHMRDKEFAAKLRKAPSAAALCSLLCDRQHL